MSCHLEYTSTKQEDSRFKTREFEADFEYKEITFHRRAHMSRHLTMPPTKKINRLVDRYSFLHIVAYQSCPSHKYGISNSQLRKAGLGFRNQPHMESAMIYITSCIFLDSDDHPNGVNCILKLNLSRNPKGYILTVHLPVLYLHTFPISSTGATELHVFKMNTCITCQEYVCSCILFWGYVFACLPILSDYCEAIHWGKSWNIPLIGHESSAGYHAKHNFTLIVVIYSHQHVFGRSNWAPWSCEASTLPTTPPFHPLNILSCKLSYRVCRMVFMKGN